MNRYDSLGSKLIPSCTDKMNSMIGRLFGRLTVVSSAGKVINGKSVRYFVNTKCFCGNECIHEMSSLTSGSALSCGCLRRELLSSMATKHGMAIHGKTRGKEYRAWQNILRRCDNKKSPNWKLYGGRGIAVCNEWKGDGGFLNFLSHVGKCPSEAHSIDRFPNMDGNYEPGNVRWATTHEQQNNRRSTIFVEVDGKSMSLKEASAYLGIPYQTVQYRRRNMGLSPQQALKIA